MTQSPNMLPAQPQQPWQPVSRPALIGWLVFYAVFLAYIFANRGQFLLIDNVNLIVHEAGHALFGWAGYWMGIYGGTLLQLLVPAALAAWFVWQRQPAGAAFCAFMLFENLLYVAVYMADARSQGLPLFSLGGGDDADHDWFLILSHWGLLEKDRTLAALVNFLGWIGMLGAVGWLAWRGFFQESEI